MAETDLPHEDAVEAFRERIDDELPVRRLLLFGSVARSAHRPDSDIDVLAVLDDDADVPAVEEELRDVAYGVMLQFGTVISIHTVTESTMDGRSSHPFFERVRSDGKRIHG